MKTFRSLTFTAALAMACAANARQYPATAPAPVYTTPSVTNNRTTYVYDQRPLQGGPATLITPEQGQAIVDRFRTNYPKFESPRIIIFVNRELVDESTGLALASRSEDIESYRTKGSGDTNGAETVRTSVKNTYYNNPSTPTPLADRATVRDVERLVGRPLRAAGASLVDPHVAAELLNTRPAGDSQSSVDRNRESLNKVADLAIEVLTSTRTVTVPGISGDRTITVPEVQATAIRLRDSRVIGQASSAELLARSPYPQMFDVNQITESTALVLMDDIVQEAAR